MAKKVETVTEVRVGVPALSFFDAWIDPEMVRSWMAAALRDMGLSGEMKTVEIDAQVGGRFLISDMREGTEARHWGEFLQLRRPNLLEFTWVTDPSEEADPSIVHLSITDDGDGCVVRIAHRFDAKWADMAQQISTSWERMIRNAAMAV